MTGLAASFVLLPTLVNAQDSIEWFTLGNDHAHTRYTPANEINADNFGDLEVKFSEIL